MSDIPAVKDFGTIIPPEQEATTIGKLRERFSFLKNKRDRIRKECEPIEQEIQAKMLAAEKLRLEVEALAEKRSNIRGPHYIAELKELGILARLLGGK